MDTYAFLAFLIITTGNVDGDVRDVRKLPLFAPYCWEQSRACGFVRWPSAEPDVWDLHLIYATRTSPAYIDWQVASALPPAAALAEQVHFATAYRDLTAKRYEFYGDFAYREIVLECDRLLDGYRSLQNARTYHDIAARPGCHSEYACVIASKYLMEARDILGDGVEVGLVPPPVPLHRFRRID